MASRTEATHDEIWDDSALVESWNQALEEYKKYHSIHARGGSIGDIPNGSAELLLNPTVPSEHSGSMTWDAGTWQNAKPETRETSGPTAPDEGPEEGDEARRRTISDGLASVDASKGNGLLPGGPAASGPQTLLGTVQDEELKKLLMSWYYAGYYTGLYEGKQQGLQQAGQARKSC